MTVEQYTFSSSSLFMVYRLSATYVEDILGIVATTPHTTTLRLDELGKDRRILNRVPKMEAWVILIIVDSGPRTISPGAVISFR